MDTQTLRLPHLVENFERRYRNDHEREHALLLDRGVQIIAEREGDYDSVDFAPAELDQARGGLITHSHPRALPPSGADLAMAAEYNLILRAVGVAPDTNEHWEYMVRIFGQPNLVEILPKVFADEEEKAERELANLPVDDLEWQRQARHLAVERLAERYNFYYTRIQRNVSISEATKHERARLDVLHSAEQALAEQVFVPLHAALVRTLIRYGGHGTIPVAALDHIRQDIGQLVQASMLGKSDTHGTLSPYAIVRGQVVPRSVYFAVIWKLMRSAATVAVSKHAVIMRRHLPVDLVRQFEAATLSPFDALSEMAEDTPQFDPLHLWVGPDKKQLGDRVWQAAGDLRRKLDAFITSAVSSGQTVPTIDQGLEKGLRGALAHEAMRLGRTQTAIAYAQADYAAAQMDPFVTTYDFFTAPQHKCCDICDDVQAGNPYDKNDTTHLAPQHPECICGVRWNEVLADADETLLAALQAKIDAALAASKRSVVDIIGPLSRFFVGLLFGDKS